MSLHAFNIVDEDFCEGCGATLSDGDIAYAHSETGKVYCVDCVEGD